MNDRAGAFVHADLAASWSVSLSEAATRTSTSDTRWWIATVSPAGGLGTSSTTTGSTSNPLVTPSVEQVVINETSSPTQTGTPSDSAWKIRPAGTTAGGLIVVLCILGVTL